MLLASLLTYPHIDPVLIHLGPLAVRWYALAYVGGVFIGWYLLKTLNARTTPAWPTPEMDKKALDETITYAILGIVLGGRLFYVLFYNLPFFLTHPIDIFKIWQGGMSFHGGLFGMAAAMALFCHKYHVRFLRLMDMLCVCAPIGIGFGRLANFINGELWGRVTDSPLGMVFPTGGPLPRYPSQLFEAASEGLLLFAIMLLLAFATKLRDKPGALSGLFLLGYAAARLTVENFREPDPQLGFLWDGFTMGQLLSLPLVALGLFLLWRARRERTA